MRGGTGSIGRPALLGTGGALYGVMAIVHDLAHGSFFASQRANAVLGHLLAPLVLLEFRSFRKSHLGHHKFSQSTADPKHFGTALSPSASSASARSSPSTSSRPRSPSLPFS